MFCVKKVHIVCNDTVITVVERIVPQFQWLSSSVSPKCSDWAEKRIQHGREEPLLLYTWYKIPKNIFGPDSFLTVVFAREIVYRAYCTVVPNRSESWLSMDEV